MSANINKQTTVKNVENTSLASNLSAILKANNISESCLAKAIKLPYNTIKRITSGETTDPKISTLILIANYFSITVDYLLTSEDRSQCSSSNSTVFIPIIPWENILDPGFIPLNVNTPWTGLYPTIPISSENLSKHVYALESRKSMIPRFPYKSFLIIDQDTKPIDGDVVLVKLLDENEVTIRDLAIEPPNMELTSINKNYPPIIFNTNIHEIIGVVATTIFKTRN